MKMHRAWMRVTAAAATLATFAGEAALGQVQYGPYAAPQYGAAPQYAATPQYAQYPTTVPPYGVAPVRTVQVPVYPTATLPTTAPVSTYSVATTQPTQYPQPYPATPQTVYVPAQPQQQPTYVAALPHYANSMAKKQERERPKYQPPQYQRASAAPAHPTLAQKPSDTVTPGDAMPSPAATPAPAADTLPMPAAGGDAASANSPYPSTNGYMASDPGCTTCSAGDGYGGSYGGLDGYGDCGCGCEQGGTWFGGIYGLYMTRTQGPYRNYTAGIDSAATGTPYFPQPGDIENYSDCAYMVPHWRGGVEARIGCTFGIGESCDYGDCYDDCGCNSGYGSGCDPCGCESCCPPCCQQYAWEVAWWGLDGDVQQQFVDGPLTPNFRYYGMVNYAGLEYGGQPVNDFYNYQVPVTGPGAETVLSQRIRTNFTCQNLELNFLRLPLLTGCCSYDSCAPPFTLTGLCGVRYFRFDDDLEFATEWDDASAVAGWRNSPNELFHDIQMENQLVGFQLGANMNYVVASRWNAFWDTSFGIYNNHISQWQRMYNPFTGTNATYSQDGREANVSSSKNDVAFLGEMRLGGGYLFTPHLRGILAYRALAIAGAALAPDQIKPEYGSWADTALINADGSLIVHGIQAGFECNY
ncbi:MAG: BBP7 family outer membrane beta-barrel protein [Pirellulales bacterium]